MNKNEIKNGDTISAADYKKHILTSENNKKGKRISIKTTGNDQKITSKDVKNAIQNENKKSKYNAKITYVDGIMFHSRWEAKRYSILKIKEKAGEIENLQLQVPYPIIINGLKVTTYISDFVYLDKEKNEEIVEDSKGFITQEYQIKRALMKAVHGITIFETREMKKPYRKKTNKN